MKEAAWIQKSRTSKGQEEKGIQCEPKPGRGQHITTYIPDKLQNSHHQHR